MLYEGLLFVALFLILGILMLTSASKPECINKRVLICFGVIFLTASVFVFFASVIKSKGLLASGACIPLGLIMLWTALNPLFLFKKCVFAVTAKLVDIDYESRGKSGGWVPIFKYKYHDKEIVSKPFVLYPKRKLDRLYPKSNKRGYTFTKPEFTVFIDPDNPKSCVDKREFSFLAHILFAVFAAIIIILGICFPFVL